MAKAKKTESTSKAPAAKKSVKPASPAAEPLIDTNLAAQNAARMLAAGFGKPAAAPQAESAMFKQLKAGIGKPAAANPLFDAGPSSFPTKSGNAFKSGGQSASYHANVAKTGVPRRNPG